MSSGFTMRWAFVALLTLAAATPTWAQPTPSQFSAPMPTGPLTIRGSVEQIHVLNAPPGADVTVVGPATRRGVTDSMGGLIFRDLPSGPGYAVTVAGDVHAVTVLTAGEHRTAAEYAAEFMPARDGYLRTRDGTLLAYRVDLPPRPANDGRYDVVIVYSGYRPALRPGEPWDEIVFEKFTKLGYAVVGVNMRGTGCSGGALDVMEPLVGADGYDIVETLAAQPWVEDIAFVGASWLGLSQLAVAATRPPSLDAILPGAVVGDFYRDTIHPGGMLNIGFPLDWARTRDETNAYPSAYTGVQTLPILADPTCLANQALRGQNRKAADDFAAHKLYDTPGGRPSYWALRNFPVEKIQVPTLLVTSWQDEQVGSRPALLLKRFPSTTPVRLLGTNGIHGAYLEGDIFSEVARFLQIYLRDGDRAAYQRESKVDLLLETNSKGAARARLRMADFEAAGAGRRYFLGKDLAAARNQAALTSFTYEAKRSGWADVTQDHARFTSAPLAADIIMAGSGSADLWIRIPARDVDLQVTVAELRPDGKEQLIQSGWLRASHRELDPKSTPLTPLHVHDREVPLIPGQWTQLRVEIFPFAHVFRAGSRILVIVSGPGGGGNWFAWSFDSPPGPFEVAIGHGGAHRSSVVLPLLPRTDPPAYTLDAPIPPGPPDCADTWNQPCRTSPLTPKRSG